MRRLFTYTFYLFVSIALLFANQSCEDISECSFQSDTADVQIYFTYNAKEPKGTEDDYRGIDVSQLRSITLYVFDNMGKYVMSKTENNIILNNDYHISLKLKQGDYKFIVWGNLNDPYLTSPETFNNLTTIESASLYLKRPQSNFVTNSIPALFYGKYLMATVKPQALNRFDILLLQNTNTIKLIAKGLPVNDDIYDYTITDNNSKYTFFNEFTTDSYFDYKTSASLGDDNFFTGSLNVLRLQEGRQAILRLFNQTKNELKYEHDLVDLLTRLSDQVTIIDWENTHEFKIEITFETNSNISIMINGWKVIIDDMQLP